MNAKFAIVVAAALVFSSPVLAQSRGHQGGGVGVSLGQLQVGVGLNALNGGVLNGGVLNNSSVLSNNAVGNNVASGNRTPVLNNLLGGGINLGGNRSRGCRRC